MAKELLRYVYSTHKLDEFMSYLESYMHRHNTLL